MSLFLGEITSPCSAISLSGNKHDSCCRLSGGSNIKQKSKINQKIYKIKQIVHVKVLLKVLVTIEFMLTKYLVKVLLKRFHLSAHTIGFLLQTQKNRKSTAEEVSFERSQHKISFTDSRLQLH